MPEEAPIKDFGWVEACAEWTLDSAFEELWRHAESNVKDRNKQLGSELYKVSRVPGSHEFQVDHYPGGTSIAPTQRVIYAVMRPQGYIHIRRAALRPEFKEVRSLAVRPVVTADSGRRKFQLEMPLTGGVVDRYLYGWQISRHALEDLLFPLQEGW